MAASVDTSPDGSRTWDGLSPEMTAKILAMNAPTSEPKATPANLESPDSYFKRLGISSKPAPASQLESPQSYFARQASPPTVDPSKLASNAASTYSGAMQQSGYIPMAEGAQTAANSGYELGAKHNLQLATDDYNRQQNIIADQLKAQNQSNISNAQDPNAKQKLPNTEMDNLTNFYVAMDDVDKMKNTYQKAAGVNPVNPLVANDGIFGDPVKGNILNADWLKSDIGQKYLQTNPRYVAWQEQQNLTKTGVLNGVLNYTPGADTKATVQPMAESLLPSNVDSPVMAYQKALQLKQQVLSRANAMKATYGAMPGMDTTPIDKFIDNYQPKVAQEQQWFDGITNPNPSVPGSTLMPGTDAAFRRAEGKPQVSQTSQYSPVGGPTPMPAAPAVGPSPRDIQYNQQVSGAKNAISNTLGTVGNAWNQMFPENWSINQGK